MDQESNATKLAVINNDIKYIKEKLNTLDQRISEHYVTKEEYEPVRNIVYGVVVLILIAVVGALVALVVQQKTP